jgi:hypothetical protein
MRWLPTRALCSLAGLAALAACAAPVEPAPALVRAEVAIDEARSVGAVVGAPETLYAARVALARAKRLDEDGDRAAADREADAATAHAQQARDRTLVAGVLPGARRLTP